MNVEEPDSSAPHALKRAVEKMFELDAMDTRVTLGTWSNRFDLASQDRSVVMEAKLYTWTASGNAPSAKIDGLRTAITRLQHRPDTVRTILAIKDSIHPRKGSLADYFVKHNEIGPVAVFELGDEDELCLVAGERAGVPDVIRAG
jgi:hypothetical protein